MKDIGGDKGTRQGYKDRMRPRLKSNERTKMNNNVIAMASIETKI